jgi:hypothetical protein
MHQGSGSEVVLQINRSLALEQQLHRTLVAKEATRYRQHRESDAAHWSWL